MIVYCITNKVNGKRYIGRTEQLLKKRVVQHESDTKSGSINPIHRAIRKYGISGFEITVLEEPRSIGELKKAETRWIGHFNTMDSTKGYNALIGGDGSTKRTYTPEVRAKMSASHRGQRRPLSEQTKKKISVAHKGRKQPAEQIRKSAETRKRLHLVPWNKGITGYKLHSEEYKARLSKEMRGRKVSDSFREKMRLIARSRPPLSDITKAKISEWNRKNRPKESYSSRVDRYAAETNAKRRGNIKYLAKEAFPDEYSETDFRCCQQALCKASGKCTSN